MCKVLINEVYAPNFPLIVFVASKETPLGHVLAAPISHIVLVSSNPQEERDRNPPTVDLFSDSAHIPGILADGAVLYPRVSTSRSAQPANRTSVLAGPCPIAVLLLNTATTTSSAHYT